MHITTHNFSPILLTGPVLITAVTLFLSNAFLTVLDLTGKPEFLLRYKMQDEKTVPVCKLVLHVPPSNCSTPPSLSPSLPPCLPPPP